LGQTISIRLLIKSEALVKKFSTKLKLAPLRVVAIKLEKKEISKYKLPKMLVMVEALA